jgi:hypothetical protein
MSRSAGLVSQWGSVAPEFLVGPELLDAVSLSGERGGMVLGCGPREEPLSIAMLRPQPSRLVLVGGLYLARQLALRAMATGAWVVVATGRPSAWQPLTRSARAAGEDPEDPEGSRPALIQVHELAPLELPRASEDTPLLVVHDGGAVPQELFPPRTPWQTTLYVLPYLHPQAEGTAGTAELVLLQRLPQAQAELAALIWRLSPAMTRELVTLADDAVVALGPNLWRPLRLVTTPAEREILGPVRRGD